jgi:hypothetical protein
MWIIGLDYHPGFQQIAFVDTDTGEFQERRLQHREDAEKFYRDLAAQGVKVRVGMEASGQARWFERLLAEKPDRWSSLCRAAVPAGARFYGCGRTHSGRRNWRTIPRYARININA